MPVKSWNKQLELYDLIIEKCGKFERLGKTMPYTSVNGYMFSQLNKNGEIGIRLSKEKGTEFINKHQAKVFKSYGTVMKNYVCLPDQVLSEIDLSVKYMLESYEYTKSLPIKKT